jgi:hypothetical protein
MSGSRGDFRRLLNRRDFGVLGSKWGAIPGVLDDEIQIHIVVGGVRPANR